MQTNQEWLHKLANESPDELKAWFDAEHNDNLDAEKVVSGDAAHSNDGNAHLKASEDLSDGFTDSREKLEADVRSSLGFTTKDVFEWLDRQAAITKRETLHDNPKCSGRSTCAASSTCTANRPISESADRETHDTAGIGASKDEIRDFDVWSVAYEIYCAGGYVDNGNEPNPPTDGIRELLDRQAAITEQQTERKWCCYEGSVQAEIDRLQRRNDELRTSYDKLKRERDNLADDLLTCNREREQLRKHLGIALDHAHDICSLVDIDGNVLDVGD